MDEYVIGSVADFISNGSSKIRPKKRPRFSKKEQTQISEKNFNAKNEVFFSGTVKDKNKTVETSSDKKVNFETTSKNTECVGLKVKTKSQVKNKNKFLESFIANAKDKAKLPVLENVKTHLNSLNHESQNCVVNEIENVEESSVRKKKFTKPMDKKYFLDNTIFVGNIPVNYEKRKIFKVFSKFGEIQSVRIRCVPISDINMSKRVAAIKKKFNPRRKSLVAYVKFKSQDSVNAALKANGMIVDGHHLRIDFAEENKERDNKKAVFVGGLPFDIEDDELWEFFQNCGKIISVHIIRDSQTSMGKGFGYVNFDSTASVELALQLDNQELKKRTIHVKRCVKTKTKHKLHSFDRKKSKEVTDLLLCKRGKKFKEERNKLKKEKNSSSNDFQGKKANIKPKKKKKLSKAALHQRKLVKILNTS